MRFMVIVKATTRSETGELPSTEEFAAMGRFNEELVNAGMMEAGEGLHPSSKGARLDYKGGGPAVTSGPFTPATDLVAGFWLLKAALLDDVIATMKRAPFTAGEQIEIRQIFSAEDFGEALTPELRAQEEELRARAAKS
jgi:hypothetical protein